MNAKPIAYQWSVQSQTDPDTWYIVYEHDDESYRCTCPGHTYNHRCKHVTYVVENVED